MRQRDLGTKAREYKKREKKINQKRIFLDRSVAFIQDSRYFLNVFYSKI